MIDIASMHRLAEFKAKVLDHIHIVYISAQPISYYQPDDLVIFKTKKCIRSTWKHESWESHDEFDRWAAPADAKHDPSQHAKQPAGQATSSTSEDKLTLFDKRTSQKIKIPAAGEPAPSRSLQEW